MTPDPDLVDAIARDPSFVAAVAAAVRSASPRDVYTSLDLPPDVPHRAAFVRIVKHAPGAKRYGRVWIVPRAAWDDWRANGGGR